MRAVGRGRDYSRTRGLIEALLRTAYRADWPARVWARNAGACRVDVLRVRLQLGLTRPVRVGFASDLHLGPTTPEALLDDAFARLREARPDVLLLGGDYVFLDATEQKAERLARWVDSVPAALKVGVLGNHDLWSDHRLLERALERAGVRVLINGSVPFGELSLVGLDDPWTGQLDVERALTGASARHVVALAHAPEALPPLAGRVDVFLCGHTHGGHVALPGGIPVIAPGPQSRRFAHGLYRLGPRTHAVVSRGVGGIEVPFRTWARPDVVVLDLI